MIKWGYFRDTWHIQHRQINTIDAPHQQKKTNYLIISIDTEKNLKFFQHPFMIKKIP